MDISNQILDGWRHLRKSIINEKWRKTHFKLIHHAIYGYDILPYPNCPDNLLHGQNVSPQRQHGVWSCPDTSQFWMQVTALIKSKKGLHLENDPQLLLFHVFPQDSKLPMVLHIILLVVQRSQLSKWLTSALPSMSEVVNHVKHCLTMDKLETLRNKNVQSKSFFKKQTVFSN